MSDHLEGFANEGLRTLCLAAKDISQEDFASWSADYHAASISLPLSRRQEAMDEVAERMEVGLFPLFSPPLCSSLFVSVLSLFAFVCLCLSLFALN